MKKRYVKVIGGSVVLRVLVEEGKEPDRDGVALDNGPGGDGGPIWRPVVAVDVDNSTGADKVTEVAVVLETTRELRTRTTRDMTAQEIADANTAQEDDVVAALNAGGDPLFVLIDMVRELRGVCYEQQNEIETLKAGAPTTITKGSFNNQLTTARDVYNDRQFEARIRAKV